jgi:AcrR family transcriptional regulator
MKETKVRIVLEAEKLFSLEGIEAVSMRRISAQAGQKNNSALQYHFGGKDKLLEAILAYRMTPLNDKRLILLAELEQQGRADDIRGLLEAFVYPFVDFIKTNEASYYVNFLARFYSYSGAGAGFSTIDQPWMTGVLSITAAIAKKLHYLPEPVVTLRLSLMGAQLIHSIASCEEQLRGDQTVDLTTFTETLIDFLQGGLSQPLSPKISA